MHLAKNKKLFVLLATLTLLIIYRTFTILYIDKIPCMDHHYLSLGELIQNGLKTNIVIEIQAINNFMNLFFMI